MLELDVPKIKAARLIEAVSKGADADLACKYAGCTMTQLKRWREDFPAFDEQMDIAEGETATRWLGTINRAADEDWKAAETALKMRYAAKYAAKLPDLNLNVKASEFAAMSDEDLHVYIARNSPGRKGDPAA
jgi:hypothetical protein